MGALAASNAASSPLRMMEQHQSFGRVCPGFNSDPVRCIASSVVSSSTRLKGDSFIREHLRRLSPYRPILPFEVLFARLGRKPEDIIKMDANENPYRPPPKKSIILACYIGG